MQGKMEGGKKVGGGKGGVERWEEPYVPKGTRGQEGNQEFRTQSLGDPSRIPKEISTGYTGLDTAGVVAQSGLTLCDSVDCSTQRFPGIKGVAWPSPAQLTPPGPITSIRTTTWASCQAGLVSQGLLLNPQEPLSSSLSPSLGSLLLPPLASVFLRVLTRSPTLGSPLPSCQGG